MKSDNIEVIRWSEKTAPDEALLRSMMAAEDLHPYVWSNDPGDVYGAHDHSFHKVIFAIRGSITFGLPGAGDKLTPNRLENKQTAVNLKAQFFIRLGFLSPQTRMEAK